MYSLPNMILWLALLVVPMQDIPSSLKGRNLCFAASQAGFLTKENSISSVMVASLLQTSSCRKPKNSRKQGIISKAVCTLANALTSFYPPTECWIVHTRQQRARTKLERQARALVPPIVRRPVAQVCASAISSKILRKNTIR